MSDDGPEGRLAHLLRPLRRRPWVAFRKLGDVQLGNQLFQIAATIAHARRLGVDPILPAWQYEGRFAGPIPKRRFVHLPADDPGVTMLPPEEGFHYIPLPETKNLILHGYFQSERFFENVGDEIRRIFQPTSATMAEVRARHAGLLARAPWSLHVRRGDFLSSDLLVNLADATDYYERALAQRPPGTPLMIFSDDIDYCRTRFDGLEDAHFVTGQDNVEDMALMTMAAGSIVSNSTFAWWGAWLGETAGQPIIAPREWFGGRFDDRDAPYAFFGYHDSKDVIPPRWRRI